MPVTSIRPAQRPPPLFIGGVILAATLGLGAGLLAQTMLNHRTMSPPAAAASHPAITVAQRQLEIQVARQIPPSVAEASEPLEVLPPQGVDSAQRAKATGVMGDIPHPHLPPPPPPLEGEPRQIAVHQPIGAHPARFAPVDQAPEATRTHRAGPTMDCSFAGSPGVAVVCGDPELLGADRKLYLAYSRALAAGVSPAKLLEGQNRWLEHLDDAALRSRQAVAETYELRIEELNRAADF
ncbi:MAG: hypothetical protein JWM33_3823 [Caulobacteraceae bacterium]|nr:hypothetical protein [Caulobacteraceae bacterium]